MLLKSPVAAINMAKTAIMGLDPQRRTKERKTIHHELFTYPLKQKPNPAFAEYFEKLNKLKQECVNDVPQIRLRRTLTCVRDAKGAAGRPIPETEAKRSPQQPGGKANTP